LRPALLLATAGVVATAALTALVASPLFGLAPLEALLLGAVVSSTDAAAVLFLMHAGGLQLTERVGATLEIESGTNDPVAVFLTLALVAAIRAGGTLSGGEILALLAEQGAIGAALGLGGGLAISWLVNRLALPSGLQPLLVTSGAVLVFALAAVAGGSGFLAVYLAGLVVGNRRLRGYANIASFHDAATWFCQIAMFLVLGLLVTPSRLVPYLAPSLGVALVLMLVARPVAVGLCLLPFRFAWREVAFIAWVGLRGAVGIFLASIPLLVGLADAQLYFDVGFVVVIASLLVQGWTIAQAAHRLHIALPRTDRTPRRVELDLPGQLSQELVGYAVHASNPYLRRRIAPVWAKLMLVVRDEQVLTPDEAADIREGDHVYFLAPPERAQALDRFFVDVPPVAPDPRFAADFFVGGDATLGALAEIYDLTIAPDHAAMTLADHIAEELHHPPRPNEVVAIGPIKLVVQKIVDGKAATIGLQLAEPDPVTPETVLANLKRRARGILRFMRRSTRVRLRPGR
jgi:cell volume regulation protein A